MMRRTALPRSTKPLKRSVIKRNRKPSASELTIPSRSPVRKKRPGPPRRVSVVRDQKYMDWLKNKPCVACVASGHKADAYAMMPRTSDPAHTAKTNGMRSKGSDESCIPLCRFHHQEMDGQLSTQVTTKEGFARKYRMDLAAIAADHYSEFGRGTRK